MNSLSIHYWLCDLSFFWLRLYWILNKYIKIRNLNFFFYRSRCFFFNLSFGRSCFLFFLYYWFWVSIPILKGWFKYLFWILHDNQLVSLSFQTNPWNHSKACIFNHWTHRLNTNSWRKMPLLPHLSLGRRNFCYFSKSNQVINSHIPFDV